MNTTRTALRALTVPTAVVALNLGLGAGAANAATPVDEYGWEHPGDTDPEWPDPDPEPQVPQGPDDFAPGGVGPLDPPVEPPVEEPGTDPGSSSTSTGDALPTRIDAGAAGGDAGLVDLGWLLAGGGLLVAGGAVAAQQRVRRVA